MNATQEVWRPVIGHEGKYEVSNIGRVRSVDHMVYAGEGRQRLAKGRILKPGSLRRQGHQYVNLGKGNSRYVHQLVLEAFVGTMPDGAVTRHLNGIPTDNRVENLAWGTHLENMRDTLRHGTHYHANKTHCPHGHPYDEANTFVRRRADGGINRMCRTCRRREKKKTPPSPNREMQNG